MHSYVLVFGDINHGRSRGNYFNFECILLKNIVSVETVRANLLLRGIMNTRDVIEVYRYNKAQAIEERKNSSKTAREHLKLLHRQDEKEL